jgi:iron uptake system component EfeO
VAFFAPVALAMLLAACSGPTTPSAGTPTPVPTGVIAVQAKEYAFTPATITVPAGSVTFSIKNAGTQDHELEVLQGDQVVDKVDAIAPRLTKDATVTVAAGD